MLVPWSEVSAVVLPLHSSRLLLPSGDLNQLPVQQTPGFDCGTLFFHRFGGSLSASRVSALSSRCRMPYLWTAYLSFLTLSTLPFLLHNLLRISFESLKHKFNKLRSNITPIFSKVSVLPHNKVRRYLVLSVFP
jgi:hypothetical protein